MRGRPNVALDHPHLSLFGAHTGALDAIEANLDGGAGLVLAFVDGNVIHPHPVLFGNGRGVRQSHRVAIVEKLAALVALCLLLGGGRLLEVWRLVIIDGHIVAAVRRLLRRRREIGS